MFIFHFVSSNYTGNDKLSDVEERMLSSKVTRLNISELYQHLNAESLLQQMVDRQLISTAKKKDVAMYTHKYAQNSVATSALFSKDNPPTFFLTLCDVLEAHKIKLAINLRSGMSIQMLIIVNEHYY